MIKSNHKITLFDFTVLYLPPVAHLDKLITLVMGSTCPSLPYSAAFKSIFQGQTGLGFWTIPWAGLLCIQFICHKHMTHHLNYGHLVWTKKPGTLGQQQQQPGKASAKVSIHNAARGKGGHCTLLKVIALPKMGPLQSWN